MTDNCKTCKTVKLTEEKYNALVDCIEELTKKVLLAEMQTTVQYESLVEYLQETINLDTVKLKERINKNANKLAEEFSKYVKLIKEKKGDN